MINNSMQLIKNDFHLVGISARTAYHKQLRKQCSVELADVEADTAIAPAEQQG